MKYKTLDALGEIGIGAATTALSQVINKDVKIIIPEMREISIDKLEQEILDGFETGIYVNIRGEIKGECMFLLPKTGAFELVDTIIKENLGKKVIELQESVFKEISDIFLGTYLNPLAEILSMKLMPSIPVILDNAEDNFLDFIDLNDNEIHCVKIPIEVGGHNIDGNFIMALERQDIDIIFERLKDYEQKLAEI